ncbi:unnamed protein product, partial [Thlaspi arvense]
KHRERRSHTCEIQKSPEKKFQERERRQIRLRMEQAPGETAVKSEVSIKDQNPEASVDPKPVDQGLKGADVASSVVVLSEEPTLKIGIETKEDQVPARSTMESVKDVIGRWGRRVGEAAMKAESLAGNTWQHLKTAPSFADAAMGRIAQSTKVIAEGGYEKIFRQTFETATEEQLQDSYACYLSTSAGPVMGVLYISTSKLAYCSDNPLSYKASGQTEWSYYKLVIPLYQLKSVNPSTSTVNPAEKYVQVISVDDHEFWFMGFLNYQGAVTSLQYTLQDGALQSV